MPVNRCRLCGGAFLPEPLLRYDNMPKAAQCMPDADQLAADAGIKLEVCQCVGCGLVQLSNDPVPYYREVIRAAAFSPAMEAFRIRQFGDFVRDRRLAGRKVIEIGCGRGEYLALMKGAGADAYGLEYAPDSVKECLRRGLKVAQGYVDGEEVRFEGAPFDAFFIMNFLEHMPDLNGVLKGICNNLAPEAVGLVEVPNFDMILKKNLFSEFIGDHLFYFTRDTLGLALQLNGFEVLDCQPVWQDYILSAVVTKRARADVTAYALHQQKIQNDLESYLHRFPEGKVAVWGAGHQALALLALCRLEGRIRYVVDSAPFKQGKYTPATHVCIVSPERLEQDPVEAVIVMAAAYSDEVAGIIRKKFGQTVAVAIMRDFGLEIL